MTATVVVTVEVAHTFTIPNVRSLEEAEVIAEQRVDDAYNIPEMEGADVVDILSVDSFETEGEEN